MVHDTGKSNQIFSSNKSSEELPDKSRKNIETYSIIALFCLIAAILLVSLDQRLLAGCLIIGSAGLGLIIVRKTSELIKGYKESLNTFSAQNEKQRSSHNRFLT